MNITDIYTKYRINAGLREHMIRVAAVAELICNNSTAPVNTKNIVTACLLHDLGNLIKARMDSMPELYGPEGVAFWTQVQQEMKDRYGNDEHIATSAMVSEIDPGEQVVSYVNAAIGIENTARVHSKGTLGEKIAIYSDMRVGLFGIISIQERMNDLRIRYLTRNKPGFSAEEITECERMLHNIETNIFANSNINPVDVNDNSTTTLQKQLLGWEV